MTQMNYRLIENGRVVGEQIKDFDGNQEINDHRIQSDKFDGMDPLQQARNGGPVRWIDAREQIV